MSSSRPPVLWSKLRAPSPMVSTVDRPRLLDRLLADPRSPAAPVWVLTAPSGYGKTTLAVQAIEQLATGGPGATVWMSVDERDDDPVRFWSHVAAGLAEAGVDVDRADAALLDGDVGTAVDELVSAMERFADPVVVVLDDVHEIGAREVLDGLARVLGAPPVGLTVVLLARQELDLPLPRLRARGIVIDLDGRDLAYTDAEACRALEDELAAGLVDPPTASEIVARIDGWPAGLRLAQLAIRSAGDSADVVAAVNGAHPDVAGYLAGEVVDALDSEVREFLLATSILDDLTPGACDAVVGRAGSLGRLRSLAADHVFTDLVDPTTSTFRYHRLLREFLLSRLAERPADERAELHRRAMTWFQRLDDPDAVIRHAVAAGDTDVALRQMSDAYIPTANEGGIETLWRWVNLIGAERVLAHPVLGPLPAWGSLNQHRYDEIEPWLEAIDLIDDLPPEHRADFEMQAAAIRCNRDRHLGRLAEAVRHGLDAVAVTEEYPDFIAAATARASAGVALALAGDDRAEEQLLAAIALAQQHGESSSVVMSYAHLGLVVDDLAAAEAHADSALAIASTPELERFHRPATAWLVRARVARSTGRVGDASAAIERGAELAATGREPATAALLEAERARVAHLVGDDETRRAALRTADALVAELDGADVVAAEVRAAHADTRFAPPVDDDQLPIGARELTEREFAVLRLLPHRLPRRELARQLFVSENTVKTHLLSIRRKLGLSGRADIAARARELGLLGPDEPLSSDG